MLRVDGLSATRTIRRLEAAQRSLAAGCDAHLGKPIGQASLLASVDRFASSRES